MNKKFELSLWRDYQPSEDIDINNKTKPGTGIKILTNLQDLKIGQCYYVWDNTDTREAQDYHWRYPCSYTHRTLRSGKIENSSNIEDYIYYFIDQYGREVKTAGIKNKEIGIPVFHSKEEKLQVLANENMQQFQGKIYNIHFISKIDGTNTLTFQVPQDYQDIYEEKRKPNEYLDLIFTKSKLKLFYEDEWYTFIVNKREEKKTKGYIIYSFEANDLAVEELSKTGFTLNLTDSEDTIEYSGLGTVKELTDRILAGTDWQFNETLTTANLQEYNTVTKYNPLTNLYEDIQEPTMVYKSHYSPALKKYVYQTDYYYDLRNVEYLSSFAALQEHKIIDSNISKNSSYFPIYYTTQTQTDCAGSTSNIIVSNSQFTTLNDWKINKGNVRPYREDGIYYLSVSNGSIIQTNNFTNRSLSSKPYGFRINTQETDNINYNLTLLNGNTVIYTATNLKTNCNYCIYPDKNINSLTLQIEFKDNRKIKEILFYEIAIRNINNETLAVTQETLKTAKPIKKSNSNTANEIQFTYIVDEQYNNRGKIILEQNNYNYILLPNSIVAATARPDKLFFVEPYKNLTEIQYATGDNTISESNESFILPIDENFLITKLNIDESVVAKYNYDEYNSFSADTIPLSAVQNQEKYVQYTNQYNQKFYYNVIKINFKGIDYYLWKDSLLQYSDEKRRLITGSRSNRYNLIQDIAQKFEIYPKFQILHNPETGECIYKNNRPIKWVYYVDMFGNTNYSGFKEGINVSEINRKIISNDVVTKMYVDNVEADYNQNGLISIQLANKNPTKENYIYNFRHYLNIGVLDNDFIKKLTQHQIALRAINDKYLIETEERDRLADTLNELEAHKISLETSLEESKANVEDEKDKFSENTEYYRSNTALTSQQIKDEYRNLLDADFQNDTNTTRKYNGFYCYNRALISTNSNRKDKTYTYFVERNTIWEDNGTVKDSHKDDNVNKPIGAKAGTYKKAYDKYIKEFKESKIKGKYLLKSQTEIFRQNGKIPYDKNQTYYSSYTENNKTYYRVISTNTKTDISNLYIRYVTSENSQWFLWDEGQIFICCEVDNTGRRITYLLPERLIENKINNDFINWLTTKKQWYLNSIINVIIPTKQNMLNSGRAAIQELISGSNGQVDIIKSLHSIKLEYYDILEKYKAKVLLVERLLREKQNLIENFETQYIQYIKEGYWGGNKQYVDNEVYYIDAVAAGTNSSIPKVEYTINVIDLSSIDYYKDYTFKIGDETFIKDIDMFGSTNGKPNLERVMINSLDRQLDDNAKNKITVKNYTNRFEEIFTRVNASVTAVEHNEATWSKADIINSNGTIPSSLLTTIHGENSEWVNNSIGLLNDFQVNEKGILLTSQIDGNYRLKLTSFGIFLTETALQNDTWTTAISAKGINADVIKTGHLMTNKVSIISEDQPAQIWDSLGISMYGSDGEISNININERKFVRLDQFGLYFIEDSNAFGQTNGINWFDSLTTNEAVRRIRNNAKVSLTKLGFIYQGGTDNKIYLGLLNDDTEGIELKKGSDTIFKVNSAGVATIAGFNFDKNHLWSNIGRSTKLSITQDTTMDNIYTDGGIYLGASGFSMKDIKLETNGLATFNNIYLKKGKINGNVEISKAWVGPLLAYRGNAPSSKRNEYLYIELDTTHFKVKNFMDEDGVINDKYQPFRQDNAKKTPEVNLINRKNKLYIGEFNLTKRVLAENEFNTKTHKKIYDKLGNNDEIYGAILSVGDNFWVHSSGIGYMGGTIYINGTLYADKIDTNSISVAGQDVMATIKQATGIQVINNYTTIPASAATKGFKAGSDKQSTALVVSCPKISAYNYTVGTKTFNGEPCISFTYGGQTAYIVPKKGLVVKDVLNLCFVHKQSNGKTWAFDLLV